MVANSEINVIGNVANHNNYAAIYLEENIGINVSGNTLSNNRQSGIILRNSNNNTIQFNEIEQSDIGIYLAYSYNNEISNNYFSGNNADIMEYLELESLIGVLLMVIVIIASIALPGMIIFKTMRKPRTES